MILIPAPYNRHLDLRMHVESVSGVTSSDTFAARDDEGKAIAGKQRRPCGRESRPPLVSMPRAIRLPQSRTTLILSIPSTR